MPNPLQRLPERHEHSPSGRGMRVCQSFYWGAVLGLSLASLSLAASSETSPGKRNDPWAGIDVRGPIVLLFHAVECPISDRYVPLIRRLRAKYQGIAGVRFYLVFPNQNEDDDAVGTYLERRALDFPVVRDRAGMLTERLVARVTPEAIVLLPGESGPEVVYRGRYDDRYTALGKRRPQVGIQFLDDVLAKVVLGERPQYRDTKAVGCYIVERRTIGEAKHHPGQARRAGVQEDHRH